MRRVPAGLCDSCEHQKLVRTGRGSVFSMCLRHRMEPERYAKYPPLPVRSCAGYSMVSGSTSTK